LIVLTVAKYGLTIVFYASLVAVSLVITIIVKRRWMYSVGQAVPANTVISKECAEAYNFVVTDEAPKCQVAICTRIGNKFHIIAQGFFVKAGLPGKDVVATAAHAVIQDDLYISRDLTRFVKIDSDSIVKPCSLVKDVVTVTVPSGTATRLGAGPAHIADTVPDGTAVAISAIGLAENGMNLVGSGTVKAATGNVGALTVFHVVPTQPGFSGAPAMIGRKVAFIHLTSVPEKLNGGVWAHPCFGKEENCFVQTEATFGSNFDFRADDKHVSEHGINYSRNSKGRMRRRKGGLPQIQYPDMPSSVDYNQILDFDEPSNERPASIFAKAMAKAAQEAKETPRPTEDLVTSDVSEALRSYTIMCKMAMKLRQTIRTMDLTLAKALSQKDRSLTLQLSSNVSRLQDLATEVAVAMKKATDRFNLLVEKSDADNSRSKTWAKWRQTHRSLIPAPDEETIAVVEYVKQQTELGLRSLDALPLRNRPVIREDRFDDLLRKFDVYFEDFQLEEEQTSEKTKPQKNVLEHTVTSSKNLKKAKKKKALASSGPCEVLCTPQNQPIVKQSEPVLSFMQESIVPQEKGVAHQVNQCSTEQQDALLASMVELNSIIESMKQKTV